MSRLNRWICAAVSLCTLCLGCGAQTPPHGVQASAAPASARPSGQATGGWHLTVYYTPVESYHGPPLQAILDCAGLALGKHSLHFLDRVQTEGFGRFVTPIHENRYLGWDFDRRCWFLARTPVGLGDRPLRQWVSAAAASSFAPGTGVRVVSCGSNVDETVCARVKGAGWVVEDHCGGCSDPKHLDLYVGEEDGPDFEDLSPTYFDTHGAVVALLG
ncbi:MAG TPA: hypothetical protein VKI99_14530 [Candidatus Dormibacteraeota bacterium]|nr:hypothetical protein [Candidatus Dormibacteraeota bacterium]